LLATASVLLAVMSYGAMTTGAWFTDRESLHDSIMSAGVLDIAHDCKATVPIALLSAEPGKEYPAAGTVRLLNSGSLALKYRLSAKLFPEEFADYMLPLAGFVALRVNIGGQQGEWRPFTDYLTGYPVDGRQVDSGRDELLTFDVRVEPAPDSRGLSGLAFELVFDASQVDSPTWDPVEG
jgi:hypothetical protein